MKIPMATRRQLHFEHIEREYQKVQVLQCRNAALRAVTDVNARFEAYLKSLSDSEFIRAYEETKQRREVLDKLFQKLYLVFRRESDAYDRFMFEIRTRRHTYFREVDALIEQGKRATARGVLYDISTFCDACSALSSELKKIGVDFTQIYV